MLAGLRHRAVSCGHDENAAVHLGCAGDHVLDVVGVARAVDVGVVTGRRLILDVGSRDGDAAGLFFRRCVDLVVGLEFTEKLGDRSRQRGLAVVNVTNRADVNVRLIALELTLCHLRLSILLPFAIVLYPVILLADCGSGDV